MKRDVDMIVAAIHKHSPDAEEFKRCAAEIVSIMYIEIARLTETAKATPEDVDALMRTHTANLARTFMTLFSEGGKTMFSVLEEIGAIPPGSSEMAHKSASYS